MGVHTPNVIAERDRRPDRAFGIVLMRDGHAEHRHEPIAHDLRDRASELLDRALKLRHGRPEEGVDLLRIE
jgi:hypothetical protein